MDFRVYVEFICKTNGSGTHIIATIVAEQGPDPAFSLRTSEKPWNSEGQRLGAL